MKKQHLFLLFLSISLCLSSCNKDEEEHSKINNATTFKEQLKGDPIFDEYIDAQKERIRNSMEKGYFKNFDASMVQNGIKDCKTQKDVISLYKRAGMANPEEYLGFLSHEFKILTNLKQKYPEMKTFKTETKEIFINSLKKENAEIIDANIAKKREKYLK